MIRHGLFRRGAERDIFRPPIDKRAVRAFAWLACGPSSARRPGAETFVYGQLPAGKEIVVRISETAPDIGSRIAVGTPRERLHLFDLEHGRRL